MTVTKSSPSPSATKKKKPSEEEVIAANVAALMAGGSANNGVVYMGTGNMLARTGQNERYLSPAAAAALANRPIYMSQDEALAEYDGWSEKKQQDFLAKLKVAGLAQSNDGPIEAYKYWEALVAESARKNKNGYDVSPFDILATYVKQSGGHGYWKKDPSNPRFEYNVVTGERRYIGPRFETTSQTRTDFTDPATARALATSMFQQLLGRDPGKGELSTWGQALTAAESANPTTTSTTTEYDSQGNPVNQNVINSGGLDSAGKEQLISEQVKKKKEYGAVQAGTTLMNYFENAVFGAPEL